MTMLPNKATLHDCERNVVSSYDVDFAALYRCVWDPSLGDRQERLLGRFFEDRPFPSTVLDAAAGTGELAIRLVKQGRKVSAHEFSPAMNHYLHQRKVGGVPLSGEFSIIEPGVPWRVLPSSLGGQSFGLVICIGAALAHCDNSPSGILNESLLALCSLVEAGGYLLVDCKRYAPDGRELLGDGNKRPLEIDDSASVAWTDLQGAPRQGALRSSFAMAPDCSLTRVFRYADADGSRPSVCEWTFRTWPVAKAEVVQVVASGGLRLVQEIEIPGAGMKLPVDNLLFQKAPP